ncbi:hypothetical protein B0H16DRAFT_1482122, partial [Mycena metata]
FNGEQDLEELFRVLLKAPTKDADVAGAEEVHYAHAAVRCAPVLVSGDCKKETASAHLQNVLKPTLDGVNSKYDDVTKLRVVSVASDGELRRGKALVDLTFVRELSDESNIWDLLHALPHMNFWVGEDDLTPDKDQKHVVKRKRNWLLRKAGIDVMGVEITPVSIPFRIQGATNPRKFFYHLVFPYICVDLTLSEQLEHLSAAAYLGMILYRDGGKRAVPTLLSSRGTVRDLRTMIGNDANLDMLQLIGRLVGTTQVANILTKYPQWDRAPRRLNLPALTRNSRELSDKTDHIKPPSWRGESLEKVTPLTCWKRGRRLVEDEFPYLEEAFRSLDAAVNINILAPLGTLLVRVDLDADDIERKNLKTKPPPLKYTHKAVSTDRLQRVAALERYSSRSDEQGHIAEHDSAFGSPCILVSEPIVTLIRCEGKLFVCVGEVTDIRVNNQSVEELGLEVLQEQAVTVHFQIVRVVPSTCEDDAELKNDWRAVGLIRHSLAAPGRLVLTIDPALSTRVMGEPYYLFESSVLRAFGARLFDTVTLHLNKSIPKFVPTDQFPYREALGRVCFVCEGDGENEALLETDLHVCPKCTPSLPLDMAHPQTILAHIGAHILHDPTVDRSTQPCGLCLRPLGMCKFYLKKSGSAANTLTLNMAASRGCLNLVYFSYGTAGVSKDSSPCSNRYNVREHLVQQHLGVSLAKHSNLWALSDTEIAVLKSKTSRQAMATLATIYLLIITHPLRHQMSPTMRETIGSLPPSPLDSEEFPDVLMPRGESSTITVRNNVDVDESLRASTENWELNLKNPSPDCRFSIFVRTNPNHYSAQQCPGSSCGFNHSDYCPTAGATGSDSLHRRPPHYNLRLQPAPAQANRADTGDLYLCICGESAEPPSTGNPPMRRGANERTVRLTGVDSVNSSWVVTHVLPSILERGVALVVADDSRVDCDTGPGEFGGKRSKEKDYYFSRTSLRHGFNSV